MNNLPGLPGLWFINDRPWYKRWETWAMAAGLFGIGFFVGRGRR